MKLPAFLLPLALGVTGPAAADPAPRTAPARIAITVTRHGFEPGTITVPAKQPVQLVFTRTTDATCATRVVLDPGDGKPLARDLPLGQPVELAVTFPKAGKLVYACGMDMITGVIVVH